MRKLKGDPDILLMKKLFTVANKQQILFTKFIIAGLLNTLAGYSVIFSAMYLMGISSEISNALGFGFGLGVSYLLHRNFTFKSNLAKNKEFIRFFSVFCISYAANFVILLLLIYYYKVNPALSQILAGLAYVSTSFLLNKQYVFR
jgi:putative flippase GtrA